MGSNHDLKLRRLSFYPLNYGDVNWAKITAKKRKSQSVFASFAMEFFVNVKKFLVSNVGIDLGGGD